MTQALGHRGAWLCVRQKNIDDYEVRRQLDRLEMSGAGDGYGRNVRPIFALLELFVCWVIPRGRPQSTPSPKR